MWPSRGAVGVACGGCWEQIGGLRFEVTSRAGLVLVPGSVNPQGMVCKALFRQINHNM